MEAASYFERYPEELKGTSGNGLRTRRDYFEMDLSPEHRIKAFEQTRKDGLDELVSSLQEATEHIDFK